MLYHSNLHWNLTSLTNKWQMDLVFNATKLFNKSSMIFSISHCKDILISMFISDVIDEYLGESKRMALEKHEMGEEKQA